MTIAVPTLTAAGWVRTPAEKADALMSHFYESDKFQTYLYDENVTNVQWLIEQYGHDVVVLCTRMRETLEDYLNRYYDAALIQVTSDDNPSYNLTPNLSSAITLRVVITVTDGGKDYSFAKLIVASDSKFEKIMNLNNEGLS